MDELVSTASSSATSKQSSSSRSAAQRTTRRRSVRQTTTASFDADPRPTKADPKDQRVTSLLSLRRRLFDASDDERVLFGARPRTSSGTTRIPSPSSASMAPVRTSRLASGGTPLGVRIGDLILQRRQPKTSPSSPSGSSASSVTTSHPASSSSKSTSTPVPAPAQVPISSESSLTPLVKKPIGDAMFSWRDRARRVGSASVGKRWVLRRNSQGGGKVGVARRLQLSRRGRHHQGGGGRWRTRAGGGRFSPPRGGKCSPSVMVGRRRSLSSNSATPVFSETEAKDGNTPISDKIASRLFPASASGEDEQKQKQKQKPPVIAIAKEEVKQPQLRRKAPAPPVFGMYRQGGGRQRPLVIMHRKSLSRPRPNAWANLNRSKKTITRRSPKNKKSKKKRRVISYADAAAKTAKNRSSPKGKGSQSPKSPKSPRGSGGDRPKLKSYLDVAKPQVVETKKRASDAVPDESQPTTTVVQVATEAKENLKGTPDVATATATVPHPKQEPSSEVREESLKPEEVDVVDVDRVELGGSEIETEGEKEPTCPVVASGEEAKKIETEEPGSASPDAEVPALAPATLLASGEEELKIETVESSLNQPEESTECSEESTQDVVHTEKKSDAPKTSTIHCSSAVPKSINVEDDDTDESPEDDEFTKSFPFRQASEIRTRLLKLKFWEKKSASCSSIHATSRSLPTSAPAVSPESPLPEDSDEMIQLDAKLSAVSEEEEEEEGEVKESDDSDVILSFVEEEGEVERSDSDAISEEEGEVKGSYDSDVIVSIVVVEEEEEEGEVVREAEDSADADEDEGVPLEFSYPHLRGAAAKIHAIMPFGELWNPEEFKTRRQKPSKPNEAAVVEQSLFRACTLGRKAGMCQHEGVSILCQRMSLLLDPAMSLSRVEVGKAIVREFDLRLQDLQKRCEEGKHALESLTSRCRSLHEEKKDETKKRHPWDRCSPRHRMRRVVLNLPDGRELCQVCDSAFAKEEKRVSLRCHHVVHRECYSRAFQCSCKPEIVKEEEVPDMNAWAGGAACLCLLVACTLHSFTPILATLCGIVGVTQLCKWYHSVWRFRWQCFKKTRSRDRFDESCVVFAEWSLMLLFLLGVGPVSEENGPGPHCIIPILFCLDRIVGSIAGDLTGRLEWQDRILWYMTNGTATHLSDPEGKSWVLWWTLAYLMAAGSDLVLLVIGLSEGVSTSGRQSPAEIQDTILKEEGMM